MQQKFKNLLFPWCGQDCDNLFVSQGFRNILGSDKIDKIVINSVCFKKVFGVNSLKQKKMDSALSNVFEVFPRGS